MKPRVCILKTDGINCDQETVHAFELAGAHVQTVLLTHLFEHKKLLNEFQILVLPGGFSYGDDIASGTIFALELMLFLQDELQEFIRRGKLIIGICNGFQVLVRARLLPACALTHQQATLIGNDSGKFECRWVSLKVEQSNCVFTNGLANQMMMLPVAHGEGKFFAHEADLDQLECNNLIPLRYVHNEQPTQEYPYNPNGSLRAIAGVCDVSGRVFGLMPHPERFLYAHQYPVRSTQAVDPVGRLIFSNAVQYAQQL